MSAAKVTVLDAARLFVAVLASMKRKDSVEKVLAFEQLKFEPPKSDAEIAAEAAEHAAKAAELRAKGVARRAPPDYAILSLSPDHSLVDAIAALMRAYPLQIWTGTRSGLLR
jgi:hypothetical protein